MYQGTLENNITQHWLIQGNAIVASFLTTYFANHTASPVEQFRLWQSTVYI